MKQCGMPTRWKHVQCRQSERNYLFDCVSNAFARVISSFTRERLKSRSISQNAGNCPGVNPSQPLKQTTIALGCNFVNRYSDFGEFRNRLMMESSINGRATYRIFHFAQFANSGDSAQEFSNPVRKFSTLVTSDSIQSVNHVAWLQKLAEPACARFSAT